MSQYKVTYQANRKERTFGPQTYILKLHVKRWGRWWVKQTIVDYVTRLDTIVEEWKTEFKISSDDVGLINDGDSRIKIPIYLEATLFILFGIVVGYFLNRLEGAVFYQLSIVYGLLAYVIKLLIDIKNKKP